MPSLQDLPTELRLKIYRLAVVSPKTTKIRAYFGEQDGTCLSTGQGSDEFPANCTALVRVSRQVSADAIPIVYGCHKFEFRTTRALEMFLEQIGDAKQHLHHVSFAIGGYNHDSASPLGFTTCSFAMLAAASGLQGLSVSHFDFCPSRGHTEDFEDFVDTCTTLVRALHDLRTAKGLKSSLTELLEIIQIVLPECSGCFACDRRPGKQRSFSGRRRWSDKGARNMRGSCHCPCLSAKHNNDKRMDDFKRGVARRLGFEK